MQSITQYKKSAQTILIDEKIIQIIAKFIAKLHNNDRLKNTEILRLMNLSMVLDAATLSIEDRIEEDSIIQILQRKHLHNLHKYINILLLYSIINSDKEIFEDIKNVLHHMHVDIQPLNNISMHEIITDLRSHSSQKSYDDNLQSINYCTAIDVLLCKDKILNLTNPNWQSLCINVSENNLQITKNNNWKKIFKNIFDFITKFDYHYEDNQSAMQAKQRIATLKIILQKVEQMHDLSQKIMPRLSQSVESPNTYTQYCLTKSTTNNNLDGQFIK